MARFNRSAAVRSQVTMQLPALVGTAKQIEWAEDIRAPLAVSVQTALAAGLGEHFTKEARAVLVETSAKDWIESRNRVTSLVDALGETIAAWNKMPSPPPALTLQELIAIQPARVELRLGGEVVTTDEVNWHDAADALVARHGGGVPDVKRFGSSVNTPDAVVDANPLPRRTPSVALAPAPLPLPLPTPERGVTVDLAGAMRSGSDFLAAEQAGFAPKPTLYTRGTMVVSMGVDNARRSRTEHEAKPVMRGDALPAFIERVRAEDRKDIEVNLGQCIFQDNGDILIPGRDPSARRLMVTRDAFGSLLARIGCGGSSYLADECWPELRAENVNRQLVHRDKTGELGSAVLRTRRNVNTIDGRREVFGVVSSSYTAYDVDKVAEALAIAVPDEARGTVTYDGTKARFEVMFHSNVQPEGYVAGEFFKAGVVIGTGDTGGSSLWGNAVVYQNLCLNLIVIDEAKSRLFAVRHATTVQRMARELRTGIDAGLAKLDHFLKAWGYACKENVVESARFANPDMPIKIEDALPGIFNAVIERELVPVRGRREVVVPKLMMMWSKDQSSAAGPTRAAVANAFTRYAHEVNEDPWQEDEIQRAAGALVYGKKSLPYLAMQ